MAEQSAGEAIGGLTERRGAQRGLVIVNTGDGKGKTTAALGLMVRAWGSELNVRMFQFIKTTSARFGEHRAAGKLDIPIEPLGDGCTRRSADMERTIALALEQWSRCKDVILNGDEDVIVLDEFTYAMHYGWIPVADVVETLKQRPNAMHVVITGRYAHSELIDYADLVTEMTSIKHHYHDQGIKAQLGIEL